MSKQESPRACLTAGRAEAFTCPADKPQAFRWDTDTPTLALRATPTGRKTYVFGYQTLERVNHSDDYWHTEYLIQQVCEGAGLKKCWLWHLLLAKWSEKNKPPLLKEAIAAAEVGAAQVWPPRHRWESVGHIH